jgi:hypothetical protein
MIALALALTATFQQPAPKPADLLKMRVDSARHLVMLTAGPWDLPPGEAMGHMHGMSMEGMTMVGSPVMKFAWPIQGWVRGVSLKVVDRNGKALSRRLIHHINVVNFGRRQLFYPAPERIIALGQETEDIRLPAGIGVPVTPGTEMGLIVMWHNETSSPIPGATVQMSIEYSPANLVPRPVSVLPVYMDVVYPVARDVDFDLPPGQTRWSADFNMPITGRIIGAGGHLHDFGTGLWLQDVTNGAAKEVVHLNTHLDAKGLMLKIDRALPGVNGSGIRMEKGRKYRFVATYNNPTGDTLSKGAMAHMALLFAPDNLADWPKIDPNNPDFKKDLARLDMMGKAAAHEH